MTVLTRLAAAVDALAGRGRRVLVAVDGPDAAGKTVLADALADRLTSPVVRASVDDFHHPAAVRHRRGSLSPEGYYRDSFDLERLVRDVLEPFATGTDAVRTSVLVVDGVFLLRPELRRWWTVGVYLHVPPEVTLQRALVRDIDDLAGTEVVKRRYTSRYLPGQALYRAEADPERAADVVVDNSDPLRPVVLRWSLD